ncbi:MAG TPA: ABC transporter permease [Puia sp.]|nr:ABC transporter permease [Puia sp.]
MIKNYLTTTWRNLYRNKLFSLINILGLAIGLACFLLISLYVLDETSYDKFNVKADRIFRVQSDGRWGGQDLHMTETPDVLGPAAKKDFPGVEESTRLYPNATSRFIRKSNQYIRENAVAYVDSSFFNIFTLPAVDGDTRTALTEPDAVVITASTATKYFGTTQAAGRYLEVKDGKPTLYKVKAVIQDIPGNSHFQYDFFFAMKGLDYHWNQPGNHNFETYLLLKKGINYKKEEANFAQYFITYVLPELRNFQITSVEQFHKAGNRLDYTLIPLTDIHLRSHQTDEISPPGNLQYVYIFAAVAIFILLIACVNFMNLTTARSAGRAREVGIRKVLGTSRGQLVRQFLLESFFLVSLSLVLAIGLAALGLPLFNSLSGKTIGISRLFSPLILAIIAILPLTIGLLAGSYPAFFLSGFRPIEVLKSKLKTGSGGERLRSILVVFQFTTSIVLIIGTLVVYRQLHFMQTRDLGFDKQQVLVIDGADALGTHVQAFKQQILQLPEVKSGTVSGFLPVAHSERNTNNVFKTPTANATNSFNAQFWNVDYDYLKTMGMTLAKGRDFSPAFAGDSTAFIINETTAGILGYPNPIGQNIYLSDDNNSTMHAHPIIGVVKNFNFESMHQAIGPLIMLVQYASNGTVSFRINTTHASETISHIRAVWKTMSPDSPFNYRFLDASFNDMYKADQQAGHLALTFSALALIIGCMGIFGLAAFIAERRTKEIGIRKVLGASVGGILGLLSAEFTRLVVISFVIAAPLAGWMMNSWLRDFAYRTTLTWWIFLVAGAATFLIALATVSFQSLKAAMSDPVKSLRAE